MLITSLKYYMDGYLRKNLDFTQEMVKKDFDSVWVVSGSEGSGKSTLAIQSAFYLDNTITNERVVFTPNAFRHAIINASKFNAVIYDEAFTGLMSRSSMSMINRLLVQMMAEIRQKNLFVFIVLPSFFDLDKYIALWRSKVLLYVYLTKGYERGFFAFYNEQKKKELYLNGKKMYSMAKPKPDFFGRFTSFLPIDEEVYRKNKHDSLTHREEAITNSMIEKQIIDRLFINAQQYEDIPHNIKARLLQLPESTYFYRLRQFNEGKLE